MVQLLRYKDCLNFMLIKFICSILISRDIFEKFYICHEYILCGPPDVKRIKEGVKLPRNEFSVLFIGQENHQN